MSHPNIEESPDAQGSKGTPRPSVADQIIRSLTTSVRFIRTVEGDAYIAYPDAPHRALRIDGARSDGMLAICGHWFAQTAKWPNKDAVRQVEQFVYAECMQQHATAVHLRSAHFADALYIDLGTATHEVICIDHKGYRIQSDCPATFRRSRHTSGMPNISVVVPDLCLLKRHLRLNDDEFSVLVGCIIATWFTDIPQPIITLLGSAKAGKTTAMQRIADLIDPTTDMPGGTLTLDPRTLTAIAKIRRPLIFDNISHVNGDESDLLARISTGGEIINRELYTNDDAHLTQLKRPVLINGIIDGFARSDLASRTFQFELTDFLPGDRCAASALDAAWKADWPAILAGICELAVDVLAERSANAPRDYEFHRNSDVLQIIEAVSRMLGADGLGAVRASAARMSQTVLDASYLAQCIVQLTVPTNDNVNTWGHDLPAAPFLDVPLSGAELLDRLREHDVYRAKDLPQSVKGLGEALKRIGPDLETAADIRLDKTHTRKGVQYRFRLVTA